MISSLTETIQCRSLLQRFLILLCLACISLVRLGHSQNLIGTTTVNIDPNTGNVQIICETDLDDAAASYYIASVTCNVAINGNFYTNKVGTSTHGNTGTAVAFINITGVPGSTYTATGTHSGTIVYTDPNTSQPIVGNYYDPYNFDSYYSGLTPLDPAPYPATYDLYGPGPPIDVSSKQLPTVKSSASKIRPYTQGELSAIIAHAQSVFSSKCDTKFSATVPSYSNATFFSSLNSTTFIQYPPGSSPIPGHIASTTASTAVSQPGRPITLFPDFYPGNGVVLPLNFQEFVLIHEELHRFTAWSDYPNQGGVATNGSDFETRFYRVGYTNQTIDTGKFTDWLTQSCPP